MLQNIRIEGEVGTIHLDGVNMKLVDGLDLSALPTDLNYIETVADGGIYQNTRFGPRPISMEVQIRHRFFNQSVQDNRRKTIYQILNPKTNPFRIFFEDSTGDKFFINAYLQSTPTMKPDKKNNNAAFQKMLLQFIALDPLIYRAEEEAYTNYDVREEGFEFPLEILPDGIELGRLSNLNQIEINYLGAITTGCVIRFDFRGPVSDVRMTNERTGDFIQVNYDFILGDYLIINTYNGKKNVTLYREGRTFNLMGRLRVGSKFIQVLPGDNLMRITRNEGERADILASVRLYERYLGV